MSLVMLMTTRTLDRPGGLTPSVLTTYYRTRLLERFATDRPGVMGCLYRHVGDDGQGVRWEVTESWIGDKRMVHQWRQL